MEFGAFVNFFGAKDGLVHISQLTQGRPETVGEVVKEGQEVYVKLLGFDDRGKVRLSMKIVDQATGKEIPRAEGEPEEEHFESRPPRRDATTARGGASVGERGGHAAVEKRAAAAALFIGSDAASGRCRLATSAVAGTSRRRSHLCGVRR